jgi:hypothetical protein
MQLLCAVLRENRAHLEAQTLRKVGCMVVLSAMVLRTKVLTSINPNRMQLVLPLNRH